ncbi:MAG: hypothetical protein GXP31_04635 [Kiritimatiellaeota bacterium]|nr:hypothetical protein [Kiritimatiellota bacterium]
MVPRESVPFRKAAPSAGAAGRFGDRHVAEYGLAPVDTGGPAYSGARIQYIRPAAAAPDALLPAVVSVHYECPEWLISRLLVQGWAVVTPRDVPAEGLADIVGPDLEWNRRMATEVFRLPGVDPERVVLVGASAGGYQALMVGPDTPGPAGLVNFAGAANVVYNILFWEKNLDRDVVRDDSIPSFRRMLEAFGATRQRLAESHDGRVDAPANRAFLPFDRLARLRCPCLHVYSTADRLVPVYELDSDAPPPGPEWPRGLIWRMEDVLDTAACRGSLLRALPPDAVERLYPPLLDPQTDDGIAPAAVNERVEGGLAVVNVPFSRTVQHSAVMVDEGPIHPEAGHTRRPFFPDPVPFCRFCFECAEVRSPSGR